MYIVSSIPTKFNKILCGSLRGVGLTKKPGLKDWLTGQTLYNPLNFVVLGIII